jgi:hypothetical protein
MVVPSKHHHSGARNRLVNVDDWSKAPAKLAMLYGYGEIALLLAEVEES